MDKVRFEAVDNDGFAFSMDFINEDVAEEFATMLITSGDLEPENYSIGPSPDFADFDSRVDSELN